MNIIKVEFNTRIFQNIVRIIKIYTILIMPLLHIKLDYRKVNNKNTFNLTIPEEIPSQMVRIKDSTIILSGNYLQYGQAITPTTSVKLPLTSFDNVLSGSRVFIRFIDSNIINSRQLLSTTDSMGIALPLNYCMGRDKYQYHYINQEIHTHGIPKNFTIEVFLDDNKSADFNKIINNVDKIETIDFTLEYDNLD